MVLHALIVLVQAAFLIPTSRRMAQLVTRTEESEAKAHLKVDAMTLDLRNRLDLETELVAQPDWAA